MLGSELHRLGRRGAGRVRRVRRRADWRVAEDRSAGRIRGVNRASGAREEVTRACGVHDESAQSGRQWPLRPEREELVWENRIHPLEVQRDPREQ